MTASTATRAEDVHLSSYVPRLVLEWAAEHPGEQHRVVEGSLAFCDLSGFTAMSEKLAKLGRQGAEELSDVLNTIFGALLSDAAAFGGSMLKYGGDAVLVFFWGHGHEARAVAACHRMRATLRHIGTVRTAGGTVRVRMSVGVHSGSFDAFLVGESHRELLVCGPGATLTCAMETAADAGEILVSAATAAALPASCVGDAKDTGFLLRRAPRAEERDPEEWGSSPEVDPGPFVPLGLRSYLAAGAADAEHRHATVAFIAFGGVDALLRQQGAAASAAVLNAFVGACQRAFERYGVCFLTADVYGDGGKVIGTTGAPLAYEDNEERMLRAAREIADGEHELDVHIGLNRGYVFSGDVGPSFRRTYTILGDAVNTAARVMASCTEHNQVRAMPEVVDRALSRFETTEQPPFAAKGKALPLSTVAVGAPLGLRTEVTRPELVGRDQEVERLAKVWAESAAGGGNTVALVGDAGVGKTRLLDELASVASSSGAATLTTYAERYEQDTAYFVLRQLVRSVLSLAAEPTTREIAAAVTAIAPDQRPWAPLVAQVFALDMDATPEVAALEENNVADRLAAVVVALLDAALKGPALWIVDNADLADAASLAVLAAVQPRQRTRPWLIALAQRADDPVVATAPDGVITVGPLGEVTTARLARLLDPQLLPHDAAQYAHRSGGNPMFLRQLVAAGAAGEAMADSVETAVGARVDALAPQHRVVLRTASVLGGRFELGMLRELLDDGRAPDLGALSDFVAPTDAGDHIFRQAIYREVAYSGLTYRKRRTLHHAAGRALEASRTEANRATGRLSMHFHEAHDWERSWRYSREAGDRAYLTAAKPVAVTFYERALEAGSRLRVSPEEVATVANSLGKSLFFAGRRSAAEMAYRRAARLAPRGTPLAASVAHHLAVMFLESGRADLARRWIARGLEDLGDATDASARSARVGLLGGLTAIALGRGRLDEAIAVCETAVSHAGTNPSDASQAEQFLAHVYHAVGRLEEAVAHAQRAVELGRRSPFRGSLGNALNTLASAYQLQGKWALAVPLLLEAADAYQAAGNEASYALAVANRAEILIDQARWNEARPLVLDAIATFRVLGGEEAGFAAALAGRIEARTGDSGVDWSTVPDPAGYMRAVPIEIALADGDGARALAALDAATDAPLLQWPSLLRGLALRLLGHADAASTLEQALAEAGDDDPFGVALALMALGRNHEAQPILEELGVVALPRWLSA